MRRGKRLGATVLAALAVAVRGYAELTMPAVFGSGMVLQRDAPIPVWGRAAPGQTVTVTVADRTALADAGADGVWRADLASFPAGGPHEMVVRGGGEIRFTDVWIGEVWLASGQSNMQWPLNRSEGGQEAIAGSRDAGFRLFLVGRATRQEPGGDVTGSWRVCGPDHVASFSAVAYAFGRRLREQLGVPIGLIQSAVGGTPAEAWVSRETLESHPAFSPILASYEQAAARWPEALEAHSAAMAEWNRVVREQGREAAGRAPAEPMGPGNPRAPAGLFNAMIRPLAPYALRGAIWYQGEGNSGRHDQYRILLPALIADWRALWGETLCFGIVQLAAFRSFQADPNQTGAWPWLREAQAEVAFADPRCGLAVTIDVGDADDIHPANKDAVGDRLARWALARVYGLSVPHSGPVLRSAAFAEGEAVCAFDHADGGLRDSDGGSRPAGFSLAGADGVFIWAEAEIDGDTVRIRSPAVPEPAAVRYAWGDNPPAGLFNGAGLPAVPFRFERP